MSANDRSAEILIVGADFHAIELRTLALMLDHAEVPTMPTNTTPMPMKEPHRSDWAQRRPRRRRRK